MHDALLLVVYIGLGFAWGIQVMWVNPQMVARMKRGQQLSPLAPASGEAGPKAADRLSRLLAHSGPQYSS